MCRESSKKDPRNALPSWNGYEYQGQIALIVALEKMIESEFEPQKHLLVLEDVEDFSIYREGILISTHQVKATDKKNVNDYAEALYYMAKSLQEKSDSEYAIAYLHTSEELDTTDWKADVKDAIEGFRPKAQKELEKCLSDDTELQNVVEKLKERYQISKKKTFKTGRKTMWEKVYQLMPDVEDENEIIIDNLRDAIIQHLGTLEKIDLSLNGLGDRIRYYKYKDNSKNVKCEDTREKIEELMRVYWSEDERTARKGSENLYRYKLQELVCEFVVTHRKGKLGGDGIEFAKIGEILNCISGLSTNESVLLRNKDELFRAIDEYCIYGCQKENGCQTCDIDNKKAWFKEMSYGELERAFYMMSPHITQKVEDDPTFITDAVKDGYLYTLYEKEYGEVVQNCKIVYQEGIENFQLTGVYVPKTTARAIGDKLTENATVEKICTQLEENPEFRKVQMEIDALVVKHNEKEDKVMIDKLCSKITEMKPKDISYYKITKKKKIYLIDAEKFIEETKGESRE